MPPSSPPQNPRIKSPANSTVPYRSTPVVTYTLIGACAFTFLYEVTFSSAEMQRFFMGCAFAPELGGLNIVRLCSNHVMIGTNAMGKEPLFESDQVLRASRSCSPLRRIKK